ncbi:MAG TPA: aminoglycoside phosphotransferase family protein [Ktedonobacteraceae bacterium]|nr:aminoglycoside phosphotransferase family protein [Ktedonobacteraceae bacterium]
MDFFIYESVKCIFSTNPINVQRVAEGVSTCVYRIIFQRETFYLRVLPEEGASFAPEVAVHKYLRQLQVKVPEVIYFDHLYEPLQRSVMVTTEIKGVPLSASSELSQDELATIMVEAGRDLARINSMRVEGFGWVKHNLLDTDIEHICAERATDRAFMLEYWEADLAYLGEQILDASEIVALERVRASYDFLLSSEPGYLAHGDFDMTHIFQENGRYTGIIDFGEIRGTNRWYDLGHFHMRDGEYISYSHWLSLIRGYGEATLLPPNHEESIRFASILINIRALARSLRKHPPNRFTRHQLKVLREDIAVLLSGIL